MVNNQIILCLIKERPVQGAIEFSMSLVCSFYSKESIVSISSQFQFSGLRMSSVDPLSGQVPIEVA